MKSTGRLQVISIFAIATLWGPARAWSLRSAAAGLVKGLDAAARVRGVGVIALDDQGRVQGTHLLIPSLEHVDVVEAPVDPEALPVRSIGSLLGLSGPRESYHRVKVEGVVTLQENQKLLLQDASGAAGDF